MGIFFRLIMGQLRRLFGDRRVSFEYLAVQELNPIVFAFHQNRLLGDRRIPVGYLPSMALCDDDVCVGVGQFDLATSGRAFTICLYVSRVG